MSTVRTGSVLDEIVEAKRADLAQERAALPLGEVRDNAERDDESRRRPDRDLVQSNGHRRDGLHIVAEIKRASPSKGVLADGIDPAAWALAYEAGGADAISVLTERHYFLGSLDDLRAVRAAVELPVLRKDFLFDPYHIYQARAAGADSLLLIVAILEQQALVDLLALSRELGMDPLVEVHTEEELDRALAAGGRLIGINNRDLHTFDVDLSVTERLAPRIPMDRTIVGESGVSVAADATRLRDAGVDAILVGETLMRSGLQGIRGKIAELKGASL